MKKIIKKLFTTVCAFTVVASCVLSSAACGPTIVDEGEEGKTNITVGIYSGGYGTEWLDKAVERFEKKYADYSFNEGETGVHVIVNKDKSYTSNNLATTVKNDDSINVYFAAEVPYEQLKLDNALYEITDLVKETVNEQDGKTIESKLTDDYKNYLGRAGKYYALPLYETYSGLTYDAGVFAEKNLYFSKNLDSSSSNKYPETNAFVNSQTDERSCGPDGVFGTYDDGLPSTYEEFYKLIDKMILNGVTPFVFTFNYHEYTNMLVSSLFANYVGVDGLNALKNFNTNGKEIEIVSGFNNASPVVENMALTRENANKITKSLGLYYASEFVSKVFSDNRYYNTSNTASTHLDAMEIFLKSGLDGQGKVGMIIEGSYWYNEASDDGLFVDLEDSFPVTYNQKDFKFMPLPHQYSGTVTPRTADNAMTPVLINSGAYSFAFINANIPDDRISAAKAFLSFCYGDEELCAATKESNGIVRSVNYDFSNVELNSYANSVLEMRLQALEGNSFINMMSTDSVFLGNTKLFSLIHASDFWKSGNFTDCYKAFHDGKMTAINYFNGLEITDSEWNALLG